MKVIKMDEYIRMSVNMCNGREIVFLGAGASIQSHIPAAGDMIWEFKRNLYCAHNNVSIDAFRDLQSDSTRKTLQSFFDELVGYPKLWSPEEYSFYFEKCYPTIESRRDYISRKCNNNKPSIGYLCLGAMICQRKINTVVTTNFDSLVGFGINTICPTQQYVTVSASLNPGLNIKSDTPIIIKLHGDYLYDKIQNTSDELKTLENNVKNIAITQFNKGHLLVVGYGGNDESVVNWLKEQASNNAFLPYGIVWSFLKGTKLNDKVKDLLLTYERNGKEVLLLEISNFDDFMYKLYTSKCKEESIISNLSYSYLPVVGYSFSSDVRSLPFIKFNAFVNAPSGIPNSYYVATTNIANYSDLRKIIKDKDIIAMLKGGKLLFACTDEEQSYLQNYITGSIETCEFNKRFLYRDNSIELGLLYELIIKNLCKSKRLERAGKRKVYDTSSSFSYGNSLVCYEAMGITLQCNNNSLFLIIVPTIEIQKVDGSIINDEERKKTINSILSKRYNSDVASNLLFWQKLIDEYNKFEFRLGDFCLSFNRIAVSNGGKLRKDNWPSVNAYEFSEPLMQSCLQGHVNQLVGLIEDGPYDLLYRSKKNIQFAMLYHSDSKKRIFEYLEKLNQSFSSEKNEGYIKNYPGFENIYRATLRLPDSESSLSVSYNTDLALIKSAPEYYQILTEKISTLFDKRDLFDVLVIHIPKYAKHLRQFNEFDLHDSLKLFCANNQIKVQIIEDKSIDSTQSLKVKWGLSTGIYAKSNGELWMPKYFDDETAFIGFSYSLMPNGKFYVGCSQLFDSCGHGMRLIINQLKDPIIIRKNPYMTKDDAQFIIGNLLRSYYRSCPTAKLKRVVIHKTTPFVKSEIEGINLALAGIDKVELLQIQEYSDWRAIVFNNEYNNGISNFSIKRGTVVHLDDRKLLIWTHGCLKNPELKGTLNYYKGGRGIPSPIQITRYQGDSSADLIVKEILMLTKMNWNSGDSLYKSIPVTIDFSKIVARMAKQDSVLLNETYDFRYFM